MSLSPQSFLACLGLGLVLLPSGGAWAGGVGQAGVQGMEMEAVEPSLDFSRVGYREGLQPPAVAAVLRVEAVKGDATALLQAALDAVAARVPGADGFRGALVLGAGRFEVTGSLVVKASGVVLRGSGRGPGGTELVATGISRRSLLEVRGPLPVEGPGVAIVGDVEAGASDLILEGLDGLAVGDRVLVRRPCTQAWIDSLGMNHHPGSFANLRVIWQPDSRELAWDRRVVALDPVSRRVTLDAPITCALERRFGGGTLHRVPVQEAFLQGIGLEDMSVVSAYDSANSADEEHAWIGVVLEGVEDAWVRDLDFRHFAGSAVRVGGRARRVSVLDCASRVPVSELGGYRRQSFLVEGQQVLVRGCVAQEGLNDFAVGQLTAGPVVFLDCRAEGARGDSGAFESWASGVLYENVVVEGSGLRLTLDWTRGQGGGWTAANSLAWNCRAASFDLRGPAGAENRRVESARPLYARQLARRLGAAAASAAPARAVDSGTGVPLFSFSPPPAAAPVTRQPLEIVNGRFVIGGRTVWGGYVDEGWWRGQTYPALAVKLGGRTLTRFVPGRSGPGLTEDLDAMAAEYRAAGHRVFFGGVGLWYDRRRDDHTTEARDAQVWAPFYEMPWARSGKGRAVDGLSLYDLSRFNPWFFERTRRWSEACEREGLVHYHYLYNTHNVLETLAHWVDFPWRPANCVNETGLPEPAPLDAGRTVHLADQFYDVAHAGRRELHRAYILHTLDELGKGRNILFGVGYQFAGPLAFQQFFIDTVAEWEARTGRTVRLALTTSKDITDAILADPVRSRHIALIDQRYWQYRPEGGMWAPRGDRNLAFREMTTQQFGKLSDTPPPTTPELAYRQLREYRDRFPDRAILAWHNGLDGLPAFMGGAANVILRYRSFQARADEIPDMSAFDRFVRDELGGLLMQLSPKDGLLEDPVHNWCLADPDERQLLLYSSGGNTGLVLRRPLVSQAWQATWLEPRSGERRPGPDAAGLVPGRRIQMPDTRAWLLRLSPANP